MADVSNLRANINGVFETFGVKDKIARENTENLSNALSAAQIVNSASGSIASFSDGADDIPVRSLSVDLEPIQDLHGYDYPWPAGGGKNLLDNTLCKHRTTAGVERIINSDGTITLNGTATATNLWWHSVDDMNIPFKSGTYSISSNSNDVVMRCYFRNARSVANTFTLDSDDVLINVIFSVTNGTTFKNQVVYPQVELGDTATDFEPYSNICPISGWNAVTVTRTGKNLFDKSEVVDGVYINDVDGAERQSADSKATGWIPVVPGEKYYILTEQTMDAWGAWYDRNKAFVGGITGYLPSGSQREHTAPSNAAYMRLTCYRSGSGNIDTFSVNYPSTDHDYHAYEGQTDTIQLGQTVYGGTAEIISGQGDSTMAMVDLGTLTWAYSSSGNAFFYATVPDIKRPADWGAIPNWICSSYKTISGNSASGGVVGVGGNPRANQVRICDPAFADAASFKAAMSGVQLCYELAEPTAFTFTPASLSTLKGDNNVWSDGDTVTVDYVADPKLYIDKKIAEVLSP